MLANHLLQDSVAFMPNIQHELPCRHLRELREAGLTHVHLLPAYDFATVPERPGDQLNVEVGAGVAYRLLSLSM